MIVLKIVLIGDGGVGKTAIRESYLGHGFESQYVMTIGADFAMQDDIVNGRKLRYQIWDLAGQDRFDGVRNVYYRGAKGSLLIFDVTRPDSYFNIPKWVKELWGFNGQGKIPIVLVANKIDLRELSDGEIISPDQGRKMAEKLTKLTSKEGFACHYIETSAKTGVKIQDAFSLLSENVMNLAEKRGLLKLKSSRPKSSLERQSIVKQLQ
ncbi:MAG: GTP-binding protein [Candidatus Heimdallarchaeota archaeon]|nr:MAG: GTP-binding protein [Candidatus Heimdallarchaeota archaeon]